MSSNNRFRIGELLRHYLSGAPRVTEGQYGAIKDSQTYLYGKPDSFGFLPLAVDDIDTFGVADFRPSVRDGESWRHIATRHLDPFFNFTFNTEATADNVLATQLREAGCEGDCEFACANTPESFVRLTLAALEIQFPGGLGADLGDQDYRNLITARGQIFYYNYRRLTQIQDAAVGDGLNWILGLQVAAAALMLVVTLAGGFVAAPAWLAPLLISHVHDVADAVLRPFVVIFILILALVVYKRIGIAHLVEKAHGRFEHVTEAANAGIFRCAQRRQDALIHTADAFLAELSLSKGSTGRARRTHWADESSRWIELLLWFQGRIGGNHAYFLASAILNQMIEPTIKGRAQFDAAVRTLVFGAVYIAAGVAGVTAALAGMIRDRGIHCEDILYLAILAVLTVMAFWMIHRRVAYLEPEAIHRAFHSHGFASLKGAAEAQIPAKLARLMRQDRNRQLDEGRVHVWRDEAPDMDDDDPSRA